MSWPALSGYRVLRAVGAGGMAELFLAERDGAEGARRQVVLKRILPGFARDPQFRQRFVHEARLALRLTHVNIVHVHDFREIDDTFLLEMEYVDGCDLRRLVGVAPLPLGEALHVATELLRGLDYAHRRIGSDGIPLEIVHRDVAPGNVLVSREGEVKLTDFGLARSREQLERSVAGVRGTFAFMSPEQAEGLPVDRRTDLFSVGAVLYAALTGDSPFAADGPLATLERVRAARFAPSGAPPAVEAILARALARDREQRFANAAAMREAIAAACADLGLRPGADALAERVRAVVAAEPDPATPAPVDERRSVEAAPLPSSLRPVTQTLVRRARPRRAVRVVAAIVIAVAALSGGAEVARRRARRSSPPRTQLTAPARATAPPPAPSGATAAVATAAVSPAASRPVHLPARPRSAYLTVNADPWAYVTVDGKRRGTTPLIDLALPPGAHEVTLDNPELAASRDRLVKLAADEHRTIIERLVP